MGSKRAKSEKWILAHFHPLWTPKAHFLLTFGLISGDWHKPILNPLSVEIQCSPKRDPEAISTHHKGILSWTSMHVPLKIVWLFEPQKDGLHQNLILEDIVSTPSNSKLQQLICYSSNVGVQRSASRNMSRSPGGHFLQSLTACGSNPQASSKTKPTHTTAAMYDSWLSRNTGCFPSTQTFHLWRFQFSW